MRWELSCGRLYPSPQPSPTRGEGESKGPEWGVMGLPPPYQVRGRNGRLKWVRVSATGQGSFAYGQINPTVILATAGIQGPQNEGIGNETGDFWHWIPSFAGMTEAGSGRSREAVVEMRLRWLRGAGPFGFPHVIASAAWQARRRSNDGSPARAKPQRDCHVVRQAHHERLRSSQ